MERALHVSYLENCSVKVQEADINSRFHCHNLIHEDHAMMAAFNVTLLEEMGYEFNSTTGYGDPLTAKFVSQDYSDEAYTESAIVSMIQVFGNLNAYAPASSVIAAQDSHYATAGYNGESMTGAPQTTVVASSSGFGFSQSTTSEGVNGFQATATATQATYRKRSDGASWTTVVRETGAPVVV